MKILADGKAKRNRNDTRKERTEKETRIGKYKDKKGKES